MSNRARFEKSLHTDVAGLRRDVEILKRRIANVNLLGPWITIGQVGVDGAAAPDGGTAFDALVTANQPAALFAPGGTPGPIAFSSPWTNGYDLLPDGITYAGPLQVRWNSGVGEFEIRGEPKGGSDGTVIVDLSFMAASTPPYLPALDFPLGPFVGATVLGDGDFTMWVDTSWNLWYIQLL